jgi:hypothetical protein
VTEKDGHDLAPMLGKSYEQPGKCQFLATWGGSEVELIMWKSEECIPGPDSSFYNLIPVHEKDLPKEFPQGLVRWLK